jgi:hypothetical protein
LVFTEDDAGDRNFLTEVFQSWLSEPKSFSFFTDGSLGSWIGLVKTISAISEYWKRCAATNDFGE